MRIPFLGGRLAVASACLLTSCGAGYASTADLLLKIRLPARTAASGRYHYLPFDVPRGTERITVRCEYDAANGANVVGLGLFDARAAETAEPRSGFRGMNPHSQEEAFLSRDSASPGLTPGVLYPGRWQVFLDAYRVVPGGVTVTVHITLAGSQVPQQWYRGDLHMHTIHSDGNWTVAGLAAAAARDGLDFLCITDHNVFSHHADIDAVAAGTKVLLLRGEEITTNGGHANACGLRSGAFVDFRAAPGDNARIAEIVRQAHDAGAVVAVNHPFAECPACNWSFDAQASGVDAIEVWNGRWSATNEKALAMWDAALRAGWRVTAIGTTDSHRSGGGQLGRPATHLRAAGLTQTSVLEAIREGRAYITAQPSGLTVDFEARAEGEQALIGGQLQLEQPGEVCLSFAAHGASGPGVVSVISGTGLIEQFPLVEKQPRSITVRCGPNSWFRVEIRDDKGAMLALTNPIYIYCKTKDTGE
jgi:hypothetical protein